MEGRNKRLKAFAEKRKNSRHFWSEFELGNLNRVSRKRQDFQSKNSKVLCERLYRGFCYACHFPLSVPKSRKSVSLRGTFSVAQLLNSCIRFRGFVFCWNIFLMEQYVLSYKETGKSLVFFVT